MNGKEVEDSAVPIVNNDTANSEKIQGDFVNYIDGMGEENSPNKDDHKSVVVEKKFKHDINYYNCNCCCFDCRRCNYFRKEKGRKKEQSCGQ